MKKEIIILLTVVVTSTVGLCIGMTNDAQKRILDSRKSKIEMQLAKYKHAQEICSKDNVTEETEFVRANPELTGDYTCESFREAAKTPEEREEDEKQQVLDAEYFEYMYRGGVLSFNEWERVTK